MRILQSIVAEEMRIGRDEIDKHIENHDRGKLPEQTGPIPRRQKPHVAWNHIAGGQLESLRDGKFSCFYLCSINYELFDLVLDLVSHAVRCSPYGASDRARNALALANCAIRNGCSGLKRLWDHNPRISICGQCGDSVQQRVTDSHGKPVVSTYLRS